MIKAAFFDVDGTLVSYKSKVISNPLREDLAELRRRGIKIFLATGRSMFDIKRTGMLRDATFDGYVTINGQCCFNGGGLYRDVSICQEDLDGALEVLKAHPHIAAFTEGYSANYLNRVDDRVREIFEFLHTAPCPIRPMAEAMREKVYEFVPLVGEDEESLFIDAMPHCAVVRWHPQGIDIFPKGGGKADGIQATLDHYGLKKEEVIAFGDGANDLTMIQLVGVGVAMGNATEAVKAAADYVTDTVENEGISQALRHFGLL